ncbi:DJ-1 family glyoxalase III [Romboutsia sp. 1001216sp1]|uniref:DJ-1 family glyoxalase III n=1 Tax=Romboutsia sp. 1001216sp1 TaxID=2986997 RepID=UPI00232B5A2F|nr:DJ-1 family glyoxalase III [Romboutsia sp. 1001216sp1]MDB8804305.1 DJ-1/PfpI family protein [Romboutsia sp. 1001216sp1]MDB8807737.1 DJ-1/PfpI family protein [Romboutsia sp. 1001216sp1]MDB8809951.1 DJ-1/PfpI family protein [Romboutsia sp. 1001216sp1]MDB8815701.1 DJ-1/PfpI family protein [Romboutsia sp. 1001216sp1]MDB8819451.1 DJ-1/PfpI family protein [Romboutsia sp. 1001216sp1]
MKKVLVMLADGFEEIEAISVVDVLRRANVVGDMCSIKKEYVKGTHDIVLKSDCSIDDINVNEYDAIVLPGGLPGATNLKDERVKDFVQKLHKSGKIVAAICAAPETLEEFEVLKNRKCTSYPGFIKDKSSVSYVEEIVVRDENIITSRGPATAIEFSLELLKALGYEEKAKEIREEMLVNFYNKNA